MSLKKTKSSGKANGESEKDGKAAGEKIRQTETKIKRTSRKSHFFKLKFWKNLEMLRFMIQTL